MQYQTVCVRTSADTPDRIRETLKSDLLIELKNIRNVCESAYMQDIQDKKRNTFNLTRIDLTARKEYHFAMHKLFHSFDQILASNYLQKQVTLSTKVGAVTFLLMECSQTMLDIATFAAKGKNPRKVFKELEFLETAISKLRKLLDTITFDYGSRCASATVSRRLSLGRRGLQDWTALHDNTTWNAKKVGAAAAGTCGAMPQLSEHVLEMLRKGADLPCPPPPPPLLVSCTPAPPKSQQAGALRMCHTLLPPKPPRTDTTANFHNHNSNSNGNNTGNNLANDMQRKMAQEACTKLATLKSRSSAVFAALKHGGADQLPENDENNPALANMAPPTPTTNKQLVDLQKPSSPLLTSTSSSSSSSTLRMQTPVQLGRHTHNRRLSMAQMAEQAAALTTADVSSPSDAQQGEADDTTPSKRRGKSSRKTARPALPACFLSQLQLDQGTTSPATPKRDSPLVPPAPPAILSTGRLSLTGATTPAAQIAAILNASRSVVSPSASTTAASMLPSTVASPSTVGGKAFTFTLSKRAAALSPFPNGTPALSAVPPPPPAPLSTSSAAVYQDPTAAAAAGGGVPALTMSIKTMVDAPLELFEEKMEMLDCDKSAGDIKLLHTICPELRQLNKSVAKFWDQGYDGLVVLLMLAETLAKSAVTVCKNDTLRKHYLEPVQFALMCARANARRALRDLYSIDFSKPGSQ